jgi:hypothetical protein
MKRLKKIILSIAIGLAGTLGGATIVFLFLVWKTGFAPTSDYFARNPGIVFRAMAPVGALFAIFAYFKGARWFRFSTRNRS